MGKGWIALNRSIQDCFIWSDKPYAKGQAWVDMLLLANHSTKKLLSKSEVVMVDRGSFLTSDNLLADRWGWGRKKVRSFLELLEQELMIVTKRNSKGTIVSIVNYSVYQDISLKKEQQKNSEGTSEEHPKNSEGDTNNNVNNVNNVNNDNNIYYQQIADMYNNTCVSFPKCTTLSDKRKKAIKARLKKYSIEDLQRVFEKAESSDFLKGSNNRNWSANFDWIMNDTNIAKILDGNYDNKGANRNEQARRTTPEPTKQQWTDEELLEIFGDRKM